MYKKLHKTIYVHKHINRMEKLNLKNILDDPLYCRVLFRSIIDERHSREQYICYKKSDCLLRNIYKVWYEINWEALYIIPGIGGINFRANIRELLENRPNRLIQELEDIREYSLEELERDTECIRFINSLRIKSESIKIILRSIFDEEHA